MWTPDELEPYPRHFRPGRAVFRHSVSSDTNEGLEPVQQVGCWSRDWSWVWELAIIKPVRLLIHDVSVLEVA